MPSVTVANLQKLAPGAKKELCQAVVDNWSAAETAGINTPLRVQHFMAQLATETGFRSINESLNYSPEGLRATFSKTRISDADCSRLGRVPGRKANQEAIANLVYGGTWGKKNLGNTQAGDGWLYRGSGFIQTTGRENFQKAGHEGDPETLRTPAPGFLAAVSYWTQRGCNISADQNDVKGVRGRINPALHALDKAKDFLKQAKTIFA
jgi:putative chitinase